MESKYLGNVGKGNGSYASVVIFTRAFHRRRSSSRRGVQELPPSQHGAFRQDILLVGRHHHDPPEIPQGRQHKAADQIDTPFLTSGTQFALHRIYVTGDAGAVVHRGFAWKHRHRPTIHGPLGHSTRRCHRWRRCFSFDDHSVP